MLPFLKNKQEASTSDGTDVLRRASEGEEFDWLEVAMQELFNAKTDKERAAAFRAAFEILEQEPHEEAPHGELPTS